MTLAHISIPDGLRVRTKNNRLDEKVDADYFQLVEKFRLGTLEPAEFQTACLEFFEPLLANGHFDEIIGETMNSTNHEVELLRRHVDECRYTVIFYRVDEGMVHPPHYHHNVVSTQVVVRGKIRIREYDRVRRNDDGQLVLKLTSDRILREGDTFLASEWKDNVHWFQAVDGPALIFNTNARGYERQVFEPDANSFGRRYVDPTCLDGEGLAVCEAFDVEEAQKRFQWKSLDDFPVAG